MLDGVRIIEFEGVGPGPFAGMHLADLGADVIVIHRKDGNPTPGVAARPLSDRGKRSITLDLKDPDDIAVLKALIGTADALIEGFRPGVMERLGLGPVVCHAINPRLVFGRVTGWGQTGPLARVAGHDLNYLGLSGALWHAAPPGRAPFPPPSMLGDVAGGGLYLVIGVLAGVLNARATGKGTVVDAAILDGAAHAQNLIMMLWQSLPAPPARGESLLDGPHWSRAYACRDGGFVTVQCLEPKFYALFLDRLALGDDPDFGAQFDPASWARASARLETAFATQDRAYWTALFAGTDACVAPVLSPAESRHHPQPAARGIWQEAEGVLQAAAAPRFDDKLARIGPVPARDAHGAELRAEIAAQTAV